MEQSARLLFPTSNAAVPVVLSLINMPGVLTASGRTACCRARMQGMCSAQCSTASCGSGGRKAEAQPGARSSRVARYSYRVFCCHIACTLSDTTLHI